MGAALYIFRVLTYKKKGFESKRPEPAVLFKKRVTNPLLCIPMVKICPLSKITRPHKCSLCSLKHLYMIHTDNNYE